MKKKAIWFAKRITQTIIIIILIILFGMIWVMRKIYFIFEPKTLDELVAPGQREAYADMTVREIQEYFGLSRRQDAHDLYKWCRGVISEEELNEKNEDVVKMLEIFVNGKKMENPLE